MISWTYIFVHHKRVDSITTKLKTHFPVFVHHTVTYLKNGNKKEAKEEPTVPGLIFVQGEIERIQNFLRENFISINLVNDVATGRPAIIPEHEMQKFMGLSKSEVHEISFTTRPLEHYSEGHARIRVTSGILEGMEGYVIRIHGDRKFVTRIGNITVSIDGIHRVNWVNAAGYVNQRSEQQKYGKPGLYVPSNNLDVIALVQTIKDKIQNRKIKTEYKDTLKGLLTDVEDIISEISPTINKTPLIKLRKELKQMLSEDDKDK